LQKRQTVHLACENSIALAQNLRRRTQLQYGNRPARPCVLLCVAGKKIRSTRKIW
jgi:hypothetical protein